MADMSSKDETGKRIKLLIGQLIILAMCIAYINHHYASNILPDKQARATFQATRCFIMSKKLNSKGHIFHRYRADFLINYNVKGVQYNHWVSANGLDRTFTRNESDEEDLLSQYEVGSSYRCWYDPENPQQALVVWRHDWITIFPLMLPLALGMVVIYYAMKNLRLLAMIVINKIKRK